MSGHPREGASFGRSGAKPARPDVHHVSGTFGHSHSIPHGRKVPELPDIAVTISVDTTQFQAAIEQATAAATRLAARYVAARAWATALHAHDHAACEET